MVCEQENEQSSAPAVRHGEYPGGDDSLLASLRAGEPAAFDMLVRRYKDRIYNILYRFLGNHEDALDIAQEAFLRAHTGLRDFDGRSGIYTWLYRIAANLAKNRIRDRGRKGRDRGTSLDTLLDTAPGTAQQAVASADTPHRRALREEVNRTLEECLARLPASCRLAFTLRVLDGLAYAEIAEVEACPEGTVKSRLSQARRLLRACLENHGILQDHV